MSGQPAARAEQTLHASCVALDAQRAVLILGASGAGKSSLALRLMALGCALVADDRVHLMAAEGAVWATAPAPLLGKIEARGAGLLAAEALPRARIALVVDLAQEESERLPPERQYVICGEALPLILRLHSAVIDAAILQYLKGGRVA
ncbi:HPr kinase/phosphorylase [Pseudothioclava nitratireducens]|uniref:HPr kinase/phosphorylase n=1 Tax=Pseudothioclava nitratireducens TaxID=1928646 RepID=UPI0023DA8512|nr:serine kinase [Defluviimonas nitratireducens]MDF1621668.1 serine kinase [Defluviimonas nitratireducens]